MKIRHFAALALVLALTACDGPESVPGTVSNSTALDSQIDASAQLNQDSARNNLDKARNVSFEISAGLQGGVNNAKAFSRLTTDLLPPMLAVANSLSGNTATDQDTTQLKADFQELFADVMNQALQGINTNLSIYQGQIESAQIIDTGRSTAVQALPDLTALFQETTYAEKFAAQLAQFSGLLTNGTTVLGAIRNQQNVVINGVLQLSQKTNNQGVLQTAYQTLVQSLTRTELLSQLAQLAQRAYGETNVALRSTQLTPTQTDPNQVQMVVREDSTHYRVIRLNQNQLSNELLVDTRGLSASDLLSASNVVVISQPQS